MYAGDFDFTVCRAEVTASDLGQLERASVFCAELYGRHYGAPPATWTEEALVRVGFMEPSHDVRSQQDSEPGADDTPFD